MSQLAVLVALAVTPTATAVDAAAWREVARQKLVGLAVGVVLDGRVAYVAGYGLADREAGTPVDPRATQFRWASCAKPVTAVAALQLAAAGALDLDADVRRLVPEFPDPGARVTVRQLLGHLGGVVHYSNGRVVRTPTTSDAGRPFADVVRALDTFKASPLVCPPGERYSYTTHGYMLLSAAVQRAGGKPFAEQVTERIARPLGMGSFRPDYEWEPIPQRAVGYVRRDGAVVRREAAPDVSWKLGGGGYTSTVTDFARFAAGLMGPTLLDDDWKARMWAEGRTVDGTPTGYGLGVGVGPGWVGHSGAQEKTRTAFRVEPHARRAVVAMTNSEFADPTAVVRAVLAGLPPAGR